MSSVQLLSLIATCAAAVSKQTGANDRVIPFYEEHGIPLVIVGILGKRRGRALRTPTTPRPASASASAMTPTVRLSFNYCRSARARRTPCDHPPRFSSVDENRRRRPLGSLHEAAASSLFSVHVLRHSKCPHRWFFLTFDLLADVNIPGRRRD